MASTAEKIYLEAQEIQATLDLLNQSKTNRVKNTYEIAGVAAMLSNIYHGVENILKQILQDKKINLESSDRWHHHLLVLAGDHHVLSELTIEHLKKYLQFRHYFIHQYSSKLVPSRVEELVDQLDEAMRLFFNDIGQNHHELDALAGGWSKEDVQIFYKNTQLFEKVDGEI